MKIGHITIAWPKIEKYVGIYKVQYTPLMDLSPAVSINNSVAYLRITSDI